MTGVEAKLERILDEDNYRNQDSSKDPTHREIECYQFQLHHVFYYVLSVSFFLSGNIADCIVCVIYFLEGHTLWGCCTVVFTIVPISIVQLFSLRWYQSDGTLGKTHWVLHLLCLGILHRYTVLFCAMIDSFKGKNDPRDKKWVCRQDSDICMLHLFLSFMEAGPQLILQLYILLVLQPAPLWTSISCATSACSFAWAVGAYTNAVQKMKPTSQQDNWRGLVLQGIWRTGMLTSRIAALVLAALIVRKWFPLFFGLHWLFMTIWVILENTDFCPTIWEERLYNCVIGIIYCFDFFNLRLGKSRLRLLLFYVVIVTENLASITVFVLYFKDRAIRTPSVIPIVLVSIVIGGMVAGLSSMFFRYEKHYPLKVEESRGNGESDRMPEQLRISMPVNTISPKSLKQCRPTNLIPLSRPLDESRRNLTVDPQTTDKQYLLTDIVSFADHADDHEGNLNRGYVGESHSSEVLASTTLVPNEQQNDRSITTSEHSRTNFSGEYNAPSETMAMVQRHRRRPICLATNDTLNIEMVDFPLDSTSSAISPRSPVRKRRAIASFLMLNVDRYPNDKSELYATADDCELARRFCIRNDSDRCNGVTDLANSGNESTTGEASTVNEVNSMMSDRKSSQRQQQLSDPLSDTDIQHLKDETMSCVTSVHDYENVCPLRVARPPWCIRSWKGYTDIETYIHDDSVVRDRRRDTLISSTTGTTYSSELSDGTWASPILMGISSKQDDYFDSLAYDLAEVNGSRKLWNSLTEPNAAIYVAKPIVIDDKGGMCALDTILEEHDETERNKYVNPTRDTESVSMLVNTIDQIRMYAAENSPQHTYRTALSNTSRIRPARLFQVLLNSKLSGETNGDSVCDSSHDTSYSFSQNHSTTQDESIKQTPLIDAILSDCPILGNRRKVFELDSDVGLESSSSIVASPLPVESRNNASSCHDDKNNFYVEMSPLVSTQAVKVLADRTVPLHTNISVKTVQHAENKPGNTPKAATLHLNLTAGRKNDSPTDRKSNKPGRSPRRKFSLLREKFELKSRSVYAVTPVSKKQLDTIQQQSRAGQKPIILSSEKDDKENLAPITATATLPGWRLTNKGQSSTSAVSKNDYPAENNIEDKERRKDDDTEMFCDSRTDAKERHNRLLEQVLSSSKLLTWDKEDSLGPIV